MTPPAAREAEPTPVLAVPAPTPAAAVRGTWPAIAAVVLLSTGVSAWYCGHFVKPQSDFHEFSETGRHLLSGELPPTFKRAPLFPVVVAAGGQALAAATRLEAPDQVFAEWFNTCIAPVNAALVLLIARRWLPLSGAVWVAAWSALTPLSVWSAANAIVETPLVCAVLLTIWFAQRDAGWAYFAAMLATTLRYDAAGLLAGLVIWDLLRRQPIWRVGCRALAAATPMAVWLALTVVYWHPGDGEHYLAQIRDQPELNLRHARWAVEIAFAAILEPVRLALPAFAAGLTGPVEWCVRMGLYVAAAIGGIALLRRRDGGAPVLLACYLGYTAVHAVFPFEENRFGYPMAPLIQLATGVGVARLAAWIRRLALIRPAWPWVSFGVVVVAGLAVTGEVLDLRSAAGLAGERATRLTMLTCGLLALVWLVWVVESRRRCALPGRVVVLVGVLLAGRMHARATTRLMGSGQEMANVVEAARWVRDHAAPEQRVLSTVPGLLQLYSGYETRGRFLGFHRVKAEQWPEIVRELRGAGVVYVLWHDRVFSEAGPHYIGAWGLKRFEMLNVPSAAPGLRIEKVIPADRERGPNVWILRVKDAPASRPTTRP